MHISPLTTRVALWLLMAGMAGGLLGGIRHEGSVREEQLCGVVINVNNNAKFRARTEHENLHSTMEYLADPDSKKDSRALYIRVKANQKIIEDRVKVADQNVRATVPPPICRKYVVDPARKD